MVMPAAPGVYAEPVNRARRPAYPQARGRFATAGPLAPSELRKQLRPHRDHPDEERERGQCRGFFNEYFQHFPPPVRQNVSRTLFSFCSIRQGPIGEVEFRNGAN
jgi:hypothetical protein